MNTPIPSLVVGDVIQTNDFIAEVVNKTIYSDRVGLGLQYITGNRFNFNFLSSDNGLTARITGNELAFVWLLDASE